MKRTKKTGVVVLLESQRFDVKTHKANSYWFFLFFDNCFEIFELISC